MKVGSAYQNGRLTVYLHGELDQHGIRSASPEIWQLLDDYMPRDCVLDLGGLSFMDSSGIALILQLHRRMTAAGGRAWVENAAAQPLRVLDASGLDRMVKIAARGEVYAG